MATIDKILKIVVGVFDKAQHTRAYLRNIYEFIPGKALKDWQPDKAAENGYIYSQLTNFITPNIANIAASCGHLHIIRYLRTKEIHCDFEGVIWARENNHQEVVQDLEEHGITDVFDAIIARNHTAMMMF